MYSHFVSRSILGVGTRFRIRFKFKFREKIDYLAGLWGRGARKERSLTGVPLRRDAELERGQHQPRRREVLVRVTCCNHEHNPRQLDAQAADNDHAKLFGTV